MFADFPALDAAIGISFVFFVLALVASAVNELIQSFLKQRSKTLEAWLQENLAPSPAHKLSAKEQNKAAMSSPDPGSNAANVKAASEIAQRTRAEVVAHPAISGLTRNRQTPSYIPSSHLVTAVLTVGARKAAAVDTVVEKKVADLVAHGETVTNAAKAQLRTALLTPTSEPAQAAAAEIAAELKDLGGVARADGTIAYAVLGDTKDEIKEALDALPDCAIKSALLQAWARSGDDMEHFRHSAETWFDDAMERLSGFYKRYAQWWIYGIGAVLVLALNGDVIQMAKTLYDDSGTRQALVAQAAKASSSQDALKTMGQLAIPLGWGHLHAPWRDLQWDYAWKLFGLVVTWFAVGLGAPFWFDTLTKLGSLRNTGPKPASRAANARAGS